MKTAGEPLTPEDVSSLVNRVCLKAVLLNRVRYGATSPALRSCVRR